MNKRTTTAGKTAKKPLRAYLYEAIRKYSRQNSCDDALSRIAGNSSTGMVLAELLAVYCANVCLTLKSFGLARIGGVA